MRALGNVRVVNAPREDDEKILAAMEMEDRGVRWHLIAKRLGEERPNRLQAAVARVRREMHDEP